MSRAMSTAVDGHLSRRDFLRTAAVGIAALPASVRAAVAATAVLTGCAGDAAPAAGFAVLRAQDVPMLRALLPAVIGPPARRDGGADTIVRAYDALLAGSSPVVRDTLRPLLDLLTMPVTRGPLMGRWSAWDGASAADADAVLDRWSASRLGFLRAAYVGFTATASMAWYGDDAHGATTGYPGPPRKVGVPRP